MNPTYPSVPRLHLGTAYYPEQWPAARWAEDIRLMRQAGLTVVRLGEFAWSTLEPSEGNYCFDWLEQAITQFAQAGIVTVLGTPTAAPPAWLVQQHPDLLALNENGQRVQFGNRCHYCVNSLAFRSASRRIVSTLAECFGQNPHVIGWQIDNEFNRVCYCDHCRQLFQGYLRDRFGSLEALNEHWTTRYWSQTYSDWEQIPLPIGLHNPGLMLEFKHFITDRYRQFQREQIDALRPRLPDGVWITHNFMGWYDGYDHYEIAGDLDLASWDWYVATGHVDYTTSGAAHDLVRGYKRRNFWLMETQLGCVNWSRINTTLNKGETRAMAWHAVGHGAEAVLYWQWRSALSGQEQYHGTLLDASGHPRPLWDEIQQVGTEFAAASDLLAESKPVPSVAILNAYDSRWSIQWQRHHCDFDYVAHLLHYYRPLAARNIACDIISADAPLDGYRLVIAPALLLLNDNRVQHLKEFVEEGGHLVLSLRTGMKDEFNTLLPARQPGPLAELAGVQVEDYYALLEPVPVCGEGFEGTAQIWAERLLVLDASSRVLARYGACNGWLDGRPAITVRPQGAGRVYLVGAYLDDASQAALLNHITQEAGVAPVLETPEGVEACRRVKERGEEILILINHQRAVQAVAVPWPADEHLGGERALTSLTMAPYGVAVLTRVRAAESRRNKQPSPPPRAQAPL